jgi:two-component system, NarL family, response regulator NreC
MSLTILLADDHVLVRKGLRALLEGEHFELVAEASDGYEAVRLAAELHPEIAVIDLAMPLLNGLDASREILKCSPKTKIILLSAHTEEEYALEALQLGVSGYVSKVQASEDLLRAIHDVSLGMIYLSPGMSRLLVDAYRTKSSLAAEPLTPRERQVLQLITEGKTTKEIASVLGVSVKTAECHRTNIKEKLDLHETASLVRYAIRRGLIEP